MSFINGYKECFYSALESQCGIGYVFRTRVGTREPNEEPPGGFALSIQCNLIETAERAIHSPRTDKTELLCADVERFCFRPIEKPGESVWFRE